MWFNLAAVRFSEKADREAAATQRDMVESELTPEDIAEAQALATEWKPKGD
jgi:hypothetical protein